MPNGAQLNNKVEHSETGKVYRKIYGIGDFCQLRDDPQGFPCLVVDILEGMEKSDQTLSLRRFNGASWDDLEQRYTRKQVRPLETEEERDARQLYPRCLFQTDRLGLRVVVKPGEEEPTWQSQDESGVWQDYTIVDSTGKEVNQELFEVVSDLIGRRRKMFGS